MSSAFIPGMRLFLVLGIETITRKNGTRE